MSQQPPIVRLSEETLGQLPAHVPYPRYRRSRLTPSIVHIGVGGFHRAHQAVYLDDLLSAGRSDWSECGIGIMPQDGRMREALEPQQYLYTVLTRGNEREGARVIGSLTDYVHGAQNPAAALAQLADARTRIVSLTVTEGGYYINEATGELDEQHFNIQRDLTQPDEPKSVLGYLAEALARQKEMGLPAFTVMSCDNLPGNGNVIRKALLSFAELRDPGLRAWMEAHVAFPNGMVDGITPVTTDADRARLRQEFGIDDAWPVVTEPFRQWVLEDHFPNGRPAWEEAGVQLTSDVTPYEKMKLRLLNAGHSALGYLGAVHGFEFVHEAASDPVFRGYLERFLDSVTPLIPPLAGVDLGEYKRTLVTRFSNREIRDQMARICSEGSAKLPKFVLPSIEELQAQERPTKLLSAVLAGWVLYLKGRNEQGGRIEVVDGRKDELEKLVGTNDPTALLQTPGLFGFALAGNQAFVIEVKGLVRQIEAEGVRDTLKSLCKPTG